MTYPSIDVMRADISKVYSSPNWKERVKHMPDNQVFAIWNKFCDEGKLGNKPKIHNKPVEKPETKPEINQSIKRVDPVVVNEDYYCEQLAFDI